MARNSSSRKTDAHWTPRMAKTTGKKSTNGPTGISTSTMVKTAGKKSKGAPTGASTPSKGAPQRKSFLLYKFGKKGERTNSTKNAWLAKPFMTDRYVVPGPDYYTSGFGDQLGIGAKTTKLTKSVYTDWAETCLIDFDSGWSPTRSLAVRTTKRPWWTTKRNDPNTFPCRLEPNSSLVVGGRETLYYKAGDDVNGVRMYDLQFLSPEKMPGKVDKDTVVKGMQDFARCAVEVARVKDLSKNTVVVMMKREMDIGAIEFDTETEEDILVFTHKLATKAGLY